MLHLLRSAGHPESDEALGAMFRARKSVFVDLLKWDVPVLGGTFEVDQFDDVHATYLILLDDDARHLGSARLLPTTRPHILGSLYPELCAAAVPRGPDMFEVTRFCLDRGLTASGRRIVRDTLVAGLVEHALARGITAYSAVAEIGWFQQILAFGWRCRPLGLPRMIERRMLAALRIEITPETPGLLAAAGIRAMPVPAGERRLAA
ncbi:acyl-homoserine-lactone synthase [Allosphingosinicella deserti]|uniref:Acyl-homoserine-lactone synthase n=1 Tax=Allosphingosinicella deserti TaxID=2116704 RepID=A0A2P7QW34_9SPHN|nr:acyl-homoserine-lactone synthase [Sphingomonas deserti]PSJ42176.1 autoinducer synthase [Sphingomonas deserti]